MSGRSRRPRLPCWNRRSVRPPILPFPGPAPNIPSRWLAAHRHIPSSYILCFFTGPALSERTYWSFRVATGLLSSQLNYSIRVQHSLSFAAYAPFIDRAVPIGGAYASTAKPDQVLPLMQDAVRVLQAYQLDYFVLNRFMDSYTFEYLVANATAADQADFLA